MRDFLQRWKERKSNKGSSLVMVISIVAVIGVMAITLLTVSLMTFQMKNTNMNSKKNFYSAEQVIDDISVGLQHDVSTAVGKAYVYTLENFSNVDETTRKNNYVMKFQEELLTLIQQSGDTSLAKHYDLDHLKSMISSDVSSSAKTLIVEAVGTNALNQDPDAGTFTIKNLLVTYTDDRDYMTKIQTDIVLSCPQIDFDQLSTSPLDLTSFTLVANDQTLTNGTNIQVKGSAYLGNLGAEFGTGGITFDSQGEGGSKLITADNLYARQGASLTVGDGMQTWARGLVVDSSTVELKGTTYFNNDIVLQNSAGGTANLKMSGLLYAYGNPSTAQNVAEVYKEMPDGTYGFQLADHNAANTGYVDSHQADFSSSILINGNNAKLDLRDLKEMVLAGNSYVGASLKGENNTDVMMGESLSVKSDQRAYLVPATYIAPYCSNYGGRNPMTAEAYTALQEEMAGKLGKDVSQISNVDYVKPAVDATDSIPDKLLKQGIIDIRKEVFQVSVAAGAAPKQMVYFFLVFDSEKSAADYASKYYAKETNLNSLKGRIYPQYDIDDYDNPRYDILYPDGKEIPTDFNFYYNGTVIVPKGEETSVYPGKLEMASGLNLDQKETAYQNTFAALRHKLIADSTGLSAEDRAKTIYQYLVVPNMAAMTDSAKNISSGSEKVFKQDEITGVLDKMCAVVVNNQGRSAYEISDAKKSGYPIHVLIASGDVIIKSGCDFTGLIISGGTITIEGGAKLTADTALAQQALRIEDASVCAADYLNNGHLYSIAGNGSQESGEFRLSDYVTFDNWSKQ